VCFIGLDLDGGDGICEVRVISVSTFRGSVSFILCFG